MASNYSAICGVKERLQDSSHSSNCTVLLMEPLGQSKPSCLDEPDVGKQGIRLDGGALGELKLPSRFGM